MGFITIGKDAEPQRAHEDKLSRIRKELMARGRNESDKDSPSSYGLAMEAVVTSIFEGVPDLVCDAFKVLEDPPSTWDRYMAMHNGESIYEMEFGELREAVKRDLQAGRSELHVHKEMTHVLAAAIYMSLIDNK